MLENLTNTDLTIILLCLVIVYLCLKHDCYSKICRMMKEDFGTCGGLVIPIANQTVTVHHLKVV